MWFLLWYIKKWTAILKICMTFSRYLTGFYFWFNYIVVWKHTLTPALWNPQILVSWLSIESITVTAPVTWRNTYVLQLLDYSCLFKGQSWHSYVVQVISSFYRIFYNSPTNYWRRTIEISKYDWILEYFSHTPAKLFFMCIVSVISCFHI